MSQLNASQATTPLQHPMTSTSLRLNPMVTVQKPFSQANINLSNLLLQSTGIVLRYIEGIARCDYSYQQGRRSEICFGGRGERGTCEARIYFLKLRSLED